MKHFLVIHLIALLLVFASLSASAETMASFDVVLVPAGTFKGKTNQVKGQAQLRGDSVSASNIIVDLTNLSTGIKVRDKHVLENLDVAKFPQAILVSATGRGGRGEGILQIKGIKQKIIGTYVVKGAELEATFQIKLSSFGITPKKYKGIGTKDEVILQVTVPVSKT